MFRRRVIAFLVDQELLPRDRAEMLLSWQHSGTDLAAATLGQIRLKLFKILSRVHQEHAQSVGEPLSAGVGSSSDRGQSTEDPGNLSERKEERPA